MFFGQSSGGQKEVYMLQWGEKGNEKVSEKDVVKDKEQQLDTQQRQQQGRQYLSPIAQMDRLFDEVFRRPFLSTFMTQRGREFEEYYFPVDIFEDNESVIVKAELPGIRKEDLDIQLAPDSITISGQKSSEERVEQKDFFRLERSYGSFTRRFQLPVETLTDRARAIFKDGILEVRIPKSLVDTQRSRKLTVE
jgi:HSP20 family protein